QVRFANAVYVYEPNFANGDYREGLVSEGEHGLVFAFTTPFIIGATPASAAPFGIYEPGCRNGLVLHGTAPDCAVAISVDRGRTWQDCGAVANGLDLTDYVKGRRQYFIRFAGNAKSLARSGLSMTTVCQANGAVFPRLKDDGTHVEFETSRQAIVSAGPNREQAKTHIVGGAFDRPTVTLLLKTPRGERITAIHAAGQAASGNPPATETKFAIEYSVDGGKRWEAIVNDWTVPRRGEEPADFWSQSFCYGSKEVEGNDAAEVLVRFSNNGGKKYLRAEAHLVYRTTGADATKVTFDWRDASGSHRETRVFAQGADRTWELRTGKGVETRWVEFAPVVAVR
ncbi:MAG TPA: hypothetical protein VFV83_07420, partial [Chthoniobacteraceae bacterium]|nr:hypothetical protein [Chthoniobacteraceae bacterium]